MKKRVLKTIIIMILILLFLQVMCIADEISYDPYEIPRSLYDNNTSVNSAKNSGNIFMDNGIINIIVIGFVVIIVVILSLFLLNTLKKKNINETKEIIEEKKEGE